MYPADSLLLEKQRTVDFFLYLMPGSARKAQVRPLTGRPACDNERRHVETSSHAAIRRVVSWGQKYNVGWPPRGELHTVPTKIPRHFRPCIYRVRQYKHTELAHIVQLILSKLGLRKQIVNFQLNNVASDETARPAVCCACVKLSPSTSRVNSKRDPPKKRPLGKRDVFI